MHRRCLVLFSGGLDSILACKVLQKQNIDVVAVKFISPFFSYELKDEDTSKEYIKNIGHKYGIDVLVADISDEYLKMVVNPPHGYGKYLNPCIDCKILMIKKAISMLEDYSASFVATGEVLGQRPMSQRRDTLRIIERDSGGEGILLRPLSATHFKETIPEKHGIVDREKLPRIAGRSRKIQIKLAEEFNILDYPSPAGGCILTDPILSSRFKKIFNKWPNFTINDCILAQVGRHFLLPKGSWLVVGRNKSENQKLKQLVTQNDISLKAQNIPGPFSIVRYLQSEEDLKLASNILIRYTKGKSLSSKVELERKSNGLKKVLDVDFIPSDIEIHSLMF